MFINYDCFPFYYNHIKQHAIKTNLIAKNDRSLNELLKLQDTDGIKELLSFRFYIQILFKHKYIDKFNAVYHYEFVILLEIKNKVHKYGLISCK